MNEIYLYGEVGFDFDGISLRDSLAETEGDVALHINSCGGDVFEGVAISALVSNHRKNGGKVVAYIDGLAASAASYMALTADEVVMNRGAQMMIHNPIASCLWANADEMRSTAETLDAIRESIVALYVSKTGKDAEEIKTDMDAETWLTAEQAVEYGLADRIDSEALKVAAKIDPNIVDSYRNAPAELFAGDADRHEADTVSLEANDNAEAEAVEAEVEAKVAPSYVFAAGQIYRIN